MDIRSIKEVTETINEHTHPHIQIFSRNLKHFSLPERFNVSTSTIQENNSKIQAPKNITETNSKEIKKELGPSESLEKIDSASKSSVKVFQNPPTIETENVNQTSPGSRARPEVLQKTDNQSENIIEQQPQADITATRTQASATFMMDNSSPSLNDILEQRVENDTPIKTVSPTSQENLPTKSQENLVTGERKNSEENENLEDIVEAAKNLNANRQPTHVNLNTHLNSTKTMETPKTENKPNIKPSKSKAQKKSEEEIKKLEIARKKFLAFLDTGLKQNFEKIKQLADDNADQCVLNFYEQLVKRKEEFFKGKPELSNYSTYLNNLKKDINKYKPELKKLGIWDKVKPFVMGLLGLLACLPLGIPALIISFTSKKGFKATFFEFKKREPEKIKNEYEGLKESFNQFLLESNFLLSSAIEQIEKPFVEHKNIPAL